MGKPEEVRVEVPDLVDAGGGIRWACPTRSLVVLALSVCLLLPVIFWLPPFRTRRSVFVPDDPDSLRAEIQASFILQKPISQLAADAARLEYDIFEEIGIPYTKVSIISMQPLSPENSTYVVFGFLHNPKNASIGSPALSILRSTLIDLVLQQINMSLTSSIFGLPSAFELLKFPGGITVIPLPSTSIWDRAQILFVFKLNNSIEQILENIGRLMSELKFGLNLRSYENVYVKLMNADGSTVAPPVTVEASVLSDVGSGSLLPDRMKQLAQFITGPDANNLGLNNSVFGKVKQVQLSSYLKDSILLLAPGLASPPSHEAMGSTPKGNPEYSPLSSATSYAPSPVQDVGNGGRLSPSPVPSLIPLSLLSKAATSMPWAMKLTGFLGFMVFQPKAVVLLLRFRELKWKAPYKRETEAAKVADLFSFPFKFKCSPKGWGTYRLPVDARK
ncbi:hypothetical protein OPV22_006517 [Ensete ventricosum]|uniref:DUF7036 domain-containing protein n=1 Tax=Ensete ventricosum TaxID=4639 RepID=A0AAV8Q5W6_ENSVE|nr:hypothetical protein OPV22_006517 [Ensete ventricosum]